MISMLERDPDLIDNIHRTAPRAVAKPTIASC